MVSKLRVFGALVLAVGMVAAVGGCHGGDNTPLEPTFTSDSVGPTTPRTPGGSGGEELPNIAVDTMWQPDRNLRTVYFDYDSYALRPDALEALRENAREVALHPDVVIQIEGHCDERGTQEYNLALGERRALATREHLINLGISPDRLITISYGEEMPVALGHDESAWKQNRRCQFNRAM